MKRFYGFALLFALPLPSLCAAHRAATQSTPYALFQFNGNTTNKGTGKATFELRNTRFQNNALYLNGKYEHGPEHGGFHAVCSTPAVPYETFTVALRFKAEVFTSGKNNLITGGTSARWFSLCRSEAGHLVITLNNQDYQHEIKGVTLDKDKWTEIACGVDIPQHKISVFLNKKNVDNIVLPSSFTLQTGDAEDKDADKNWSFTNYSNADVFQGWVDELRIYDHCLSDGELAALSLHPAPAKQRRSAAPKP